MEEEKRIKSHTEETSLKHLFSEEEMREIASDLAADIGKKKAIEDELKSLKSEYKSKLDVLEAKIAQNGNRYRSGHEHRYVECEVWLDYDLKMRLYFLPETDELVKEEPFQEGDYQKKLDFD